jgi:DNA-binding CsgD family transcriptional regulator
MFAWLSILPPAGRACMAGSPQISVMVTERSFNGVGREVLADLFGLTQAESRLVQALVQGVSPSQYAARQRLSQNTVRNQLKSIFEKAEVRRQSDLVSLICNVLVPVNFENAAS